ncbi:MAG: rod shape-determining protein [Clostridia bacterium]|nr:rod shape-determining protein [Clostridia bacterium]
MNIDIAIKFGSNEIIIYRKGYGIIAKEPAYLAVEENLKKFKIKAIGKDAEKLFNSQSSSVVVYQPILNSAIENEKMAVILMSEILKKLVINKFLINKINALVAVPTGLNEEQLILLKRVLYKSGISNITFVLNSVCARNSLNIDSHAYTMVVDIGKNITDISILNDYNYAFGRMYFLGGADMDKSITTFVSDNKDLTISDNESEKIKNEVASLYPNDTYRTDFVGQDENKKFIKETISANEVRVAISNVYDAIFKFVLDILKSSSKEICADIYNNGIMFVGGSSKIAGLYEYAKEKLDLPIIIPEDPADAVILGAGKFLNKTKEFLTIKLK